MFPRNTRYGSIALTGHTACSVTPRKRLIPCRKVSVFDCLMVTRTTDDSTFLSMAISLTVRWTSGSNSCSDGIVNSEHQRKPKKAVQQAAHIIMLWKSLDVRASTV